MGERGCSLFLCFAMGYVPEIKEQERRVVVSE